MTRTISSCPPPRENFPAGNFLFPSHHNNEGGNDEAVAANGASVIPDGAKVPEYRGSVSTHAETVSTDGREILPDGVAGHANAAKIPANGLTVSPNGDNKSSFFHQKHTFQIKTAITDQSKPQKQQKPQKP